MEKLFLQNGKIVLKDKIVEGSIAVCNGFIEEILTGNTKKYED